MEIALGMLCQFDADEGSPGFDEDDGIVDSLMVEPSSAGFTSIISTTQSANPGETVTVLYALDGEPLTLEVTIVEPS